MELKIDTVLIDAYPEKFVVDVMDLDDGEATKRTADGTLVRDRIAVKRQISMDFGILAPTEISGILEAVSGVFFDLYYPDPQTGTYITKNFYVSNRTAPFVVESGGTLLWGGLSMTLTER